MRSRFTILELVTALAVVLILVAIALPQLARMQYASKHAELEPVVMAVSDALMAYNAAHDTWPNGTTEAPFMPVPWNATGKSPWPWVEPFGPAWEALDFRPDGDTRCAYSYHWMDDLYPDYLMAWGVCDVDDDDREYRWRWYRYGSTGAPVPGLSPSIKCDAGDMDTDCF